MEKRTYTHWEWNHQCKRIESTAHRFTSFGYGGEKKKKKRGVKWLSCYLRCDEWVGHHSVHTKAVNVSILCDSLILFLSKTIEIRSLRAENENKSIIEFVLFCFLKNHFLEWNYIKTKFSTPNGNDPSSSFSSYWIALRIKFNSMLFIVFQIALLWLRMSLHRFLIKCESTTNFEIEFTREHVWDRESNKKRSASQWNYVRKALSKLENFSITYMCGFHC